LVFGIRIWKQNLNAPQGQELSMTEVVMKHVATGTLAVAEALFLSLFPEWLSATRKSNSCCAEHMLSGLEYVAGVSKMASSGHNLFERGLLAAEEYERGLVDIISGMQKDLEEYKSGSRVTEALKQKDAFVQAQARA
jgi:hypothetical protein